MAATARRTVAGSSRADVGDHDEHVSLADCQFLAGCARVNALLAAAALAVLVPVRLRHSAVGRVRRLAELTAR